MWSLSSQYHSSPPEPLKMDFLLLETRILRVLIIGSIQRFLGKKVLLHRKGPVTEKKHVKPAFFYCPFIFSCTLRNSWFIRCLKDTLLAQVQGLAEVLLRIPSKRETNYFDVARNWRGFKYGKFRDQNSCISLGNSSDLATEFPYTDHSVHQSDLLWVSRKQFFSVVFRLFLISFLVLLISICRASLLMPPVLAIFWLSLLV